MNRTAMLRRQRGLTLIELLLTVVIFSLVIAIFSQALFQVALFSQAATRVAAGWQQRWSTGFALDDQFAALSLLVVPGEERAVGNASEFTVWWSELSGDRAGLPVRVRLSLRPGPRDSLPMGRGAEDAGNGRAAAATPWLLFASDGQGNEVARARWSGAVMFRYQNSAGDVMPTWPAPTAPASDVRFESLPRGVQIVDANGALVHVWVYAGLTQPGLMPRAALMPGALTSTR